MTAPAITLQLPAPLYDHFQSRAERTHRSLEAELLDAVATVAEDEEELSPDLTTAIADLELLNDDELRLAARNRLSDDARAQLDRLNFKQQKETLTSAEKETLELLVHEYDRAVLLRAEALRLLKDRGQAISELLIAR
jgi:hypothetical protein